MWFLTVKMKLPRRTGTLGRRRWIEHNGLAYPFLMTVFFWRLQPGYSAGHFAMLSPLKTSDYVPLVNEGLIKIHIKK